MPKVDPIVLPLAATAVFEGVHLTTEHLPKLSDVRAGDVTDTKLRMDVRTGEVVAAVTVTVAASVVSYMAGSPAPLIAGMVVCAGIVGCYEWALRTPGAGGQGDTTSANVYDVGGMA